MNHPHVPWDKSLSWFCHALRSLRSAATSRGASRFFFAMAVTVLLLPGATAAADIPPLAESAKIVVGGDHNFHPFEFLDEDGNPAGYNVELTRAIAEVMGMELEFRLGNWDLSRRALEEGSIDVLQGIVYSEERSKLLDFSPPHIILFQSTFARRGTPSVTTPDELRGKEVIVQKGDIMHDYLLENRVEAQLVLVDTHADALRLLASGKHDYALVDHMAGIYLGRELGLSNLVTVPLQFSGQRYGYAVRKGNAELLAKFDQGLAILENTGRHQQIYDKWLDPLESRVSPWEKIAPTLGVILGTLLFILAATVIWNRSLKTEVARRTRDLQLHQQQLVQADKMASLGILVSGVAHEINNPTGLILYNLPVLRKAYGVAEFNLEAQFKESGDFMIGGLQYSLMREEIPRMFSEMQEGAKRIKRIVEDLKDFARQEAPALTDAVDLNEVVQAAVRLVDNSIKTATDRFEQSYAEKLPPLRGNAQRIEQVAVNLLLNACHALPGNDHGIFLRTFCDEPHNAVGLEIRDEGCGIPPEHLSHLTDPFFTTKREQGGTGLGLSVSAGIIEEHQGRLEFASPAGGGTTVTLTLPILQEGNRS